MKMTGKITPGGRQLYEAWRASTDMQLDVVNSKGLVAGVLI